MKLLHKILLATDFSKSSEDALNMSMHLAKVFNSEIYVLHVIPSMELSRLNKEMIENGVRKELQKIYNRISEKGIKVHDIGLQIGIPFVRIIQEADKRDVNVILMGSGKDVSPKANNYTPGVTAQKVLHKAAKPVWLVNSEKAGDIKSILCPVDFSKPAERALRNAIHLARKMNAELTILHVIPAMMDIYQNILGEKNKEQAERIHRHENEFDKFLTQFDFYNVKYKKVIEAGKVHQVILDKAKRINLQLIIMGTSGESNNFKVLMGSNTEHVMRELPSSIITVKSDSVIQPMIDYQISDLESHYKLGYQFLENGMPEEAIEQFKYCVNQDVLYAPAWEGLSLSHKRLGNMEDAQEYQQKAESIRKNLWEQRVQAELRSKNKVFSN
jgi:nucleotide-binding universal stress UspA family protein